MSELRKMFVIDKTYTEDEIFRPVDRWKPSKPEDAIFVVNKGHVYIPLSKMFNWNIPPERDIDRFILTTKKCYNSDMMRSHLFTYLNYFTKYYDKDKEYITILATLKPIIDTMNSSIYLEEYFFGDLCRYILHSNLERKIAMMVDDNYTLDLNYVNKKTPSLQYTNEHAKLLYCMSMMMNLCIPLLTHYAYMNKLNNIDDYLFKFYDYIINRYPGVNMYAKLYDTASTNIKTNQKSNKVIWDKQEIRGISIETHTESSIKIIILNLIPRYTFNESIISLNTATIRECIRFKITDIGFEYTFVPINSTKRDDDDITDFDRFESNLIRQNSALYLQNKLNYEYTMENLENTYGPFDNNELRLHLNTMVDIEGNTYINQLQQNLVFNMFFKYFKDTESIKAINKLDFAKMIIIAKRILLTRNMIILPYIVSGKVQRLVSRKKVNNKELSYIEASPTYVLILKKYQNKDITKHIRSIVATILSSEFTIIDLNPNINGKKIEALPIQLIDEILSYILLC